MRENGSSRSAILLVTNQQLYLRAEFRYRSTPELRPVEQVLDARLKHGS